MKKNITLIDAIIYILLPGPIIQFYPLILAIIFNNLCTDYFSKISLIISFSIINVILFPFLLPISFVIGITFTSILIPAFSVIFAISYLNRTLSDDVPIKRYFKLFNEYIPGVESDYDNDAMTEICLSSDNPN